MLATGLARALVEVGSVGALFDTDYGITLLVKVALVAGLVGLGALNHFFWAPAVRAASGERGPPLRSELARRARRRARRAGGDGGAERAGAGPDGRRGPGAGGFVRGQVTASGHDYATSVRVTLTLTPGVAGRNDYTLWVDDYDSGDPLKSVKRSA